VLYTHLLDKREQGTVTGHGRVCMVGGVKSIWLARLELPSKPAFQIAGLISRPKGLATAS
jgi:hypothetical protein